MKVWYKEDYKHIELYFDEYPGKKMTDSLKVCGWRWIGTKKCWSNKNNAENKIMAKSLCQSAETKRDETENPVYNISIHDLVIRCNAFFEVKNHNLIELMGRFQVVKRNGDKEYLLAPIAYCIECKKFFILNETVKEIRKKGVPLCPITSISTDVKLVTSTWNEEGVLKSYGYTVNSKDDLSDEQRQEILKMLIEKKILSKTAILSLLDWFCRMQGNDPTSSAIFKWKQDRKYVADFEVGKVVIVT